MPESTPPELSGLEDYRFWKPEYQRQALDLIKQYDGAGWKPFYCKDRECDGMPHGKWDFSHARKDQRPPPWQDPWFVWLMSSGRGAGKTRTGSEVVNRAIDMYPRIALVSPTGALLRQTLVEGVAGILACSPPGKMPKWEPSKKQLTFPNGCIAQGFSGEEPERLRSYEHAMAWLDEPAHYDDPDALWANLLFGMRMGTNNKIICTTTPLPNKWMKEVMADPATVVTRVSTYANLHNLSPVFKAQVVDRYEGTRTGKQELHGEILLDVEGSLWKWEMLRWIDEAPELDRIVVAVDPAGTANAKSDETGLVVIGISGKALYVLADHTGKYSPDGWTRRMFALYEEHKADAVVVEKTYGQDITMKMIEQSNLEGVRVIGVDDRRGKQIRAEPIVALYEQKRVYHVGNRGDLLDLEEEITEWVPGHGPSPNRVDALVHGATELAKATMPSALADPRKVLPDVRFPTGTERRPPLRLIKGA
jgi:phage terminase large subunit-like protein